MHYSLPMLICMESAKGKFYWNISKKRQSSMLKHLAVMFVNNLKSCVVFLLNQCHPSISSRASKCWREKGQNNYIIEL